MKKRKVESPPAPAAPRMAREIDETRTITRYQIKRNVLALVNSQSHLFGVSSMTVKGDILEVVALKFPRLLSAIARNDEATINELARIVHDAPM